MKRKFGKKNYQSTMKAFEKAQQQAQHLLNEPQAMQRITAQIEHKAQHNKKALSEVWEGLTDLLDMTKAWLKRDYRQIPFKTMTVIIAALIYFLNPLDVIPDVLPLAGLTDDTFLLAIALKMVQSDLNRFRQWRDGYNPGPEKTTTENS